MEEAIKEVVTVGTFRGKPSRKRFSTKKSKQAPQLSSARKAERAAKRKARAAKKDEAHEVP